MTPLKDPLLRDIALELVKARSFDLLIAFFKSHKSMDELIDKVLLWGEIFMGEYLRDESPDFHRELIRRFFSPENEYTAAPRGFAKTTVMQICIGFSAAHGMDEFIVLIEKTFDEAAEVINGVRDMFVRNKFILLVYGSLIGEDKETDFMVEVQKKSQQKNKDRQGDIIINGVRLRGLGFEKTIRGLKDGPWRPTRIVLDDVEKDEHINSPDQRLKYRNNYDKGVQPAVDITGSIKVFGTILHHDSLLMNLINEHNGKVFRAYERENPQGTLLWPSRWTYERLMKKRQDMMKDGQSSSAFDQEYLNDPVGEDERAFKEKWLWERVPSKRDPTVIRAVPRRRITRKRLEELREEREFVGYGLIDTSDTKKDTSDFTAGIVVLVDQYNNRYLMMIRRARLNIMEQVSLVFEMWDRWYSYGMVKIGIEKKGFNDQIEPLIVTEKNRRKIYPIVEELKPMGRNKEGRIKGASQGYFENGKFIFVGYEDECGDWQPIGDVDALLQEHYDFPAAKNDDLSDALAYLADIIVIPTGDMSVSGEMPLEDPYPKAVNVFNEVWGDIERTMPDESFSTGHPEDDPYA